MAISESAPSPEEMRVAVFGLGQTACLEEAVLLFRAARGARMDIPLRLQEARRLDLHTAGTNVLQYTQYFSKAFSEATRLAAKALDDAGNTLNNMPLTAQERQAELQLIRSPEEYFN